MQPAYGQPAYGQPVSGQPVHDVQPAPTQYAGVTYTQQPPSYYNLQPVAPAQPTVGEKLLSKAGKNPIFR